MKQGEEVYFFDNRRNLRTGIIIRHEKGIYKIKCGKRMYKRRLSGLGKKKGSKCLDV